MGRREESEGTLGGAGKPSAGEFRGSDTSANAIRLKRSIRWARDQSAQYTAITLVEKLLPYSSKKFP
eukprot:6263783-Amphidinium_carterae.1